MSVEINLCIHCKESLVIHDYAPIHTFHKWCPKCRFKFVVLKTSKENILLISVQLNNDLRVIIQLTPCDFNENLIVIDKIKTFNEPVGHGYGAMSSLTLDANQLETQIFETKEKIDFDFSNLESFQKKIKMLLAFS